MAHDIAFPDPANQVKDVLAVAPAAGLGVTAAFPALASIVRLSN